MASTLLLTVLLGVGLVFFLRAASKDRTTQVEISSPRPPMEVLEAVSSWLTERGWQTESSHPERRLVQFRGQVNSSTLLAVLLTVLAGIGAACLGLVLRQLFPQLGWGPLGLALLGPVAGLYYNGRAKRTEQLELRLLSGDRDSGSTLRMRAHRDELIAMEQELGPLLQLASDGALLRSPI